MAQQQQHNIIFDLHEFRASFRKSGLLTLDYTLICRREMRWDQLETELLYILPEGLRRYRKTAIRRKHQGVWRTSACLDHGNAEARNL